MKIRTLVVDDSQLTLELILSYLEELSSVEVIGVAANGTEALELAFSLNPDLILTDLRMPGMDGLEFARRLPTACPGTHVVLMTVEQSEPLRKAASDYGIDGIVMKDRIREDLPVEILRLFPTHRDDA